MLEAQAALHMDISWFVVGNNESVTSSAPRKEGRMALKGFLLSALIKFLLF